MKEKYFRANLYRGKNVKIDKFWIEKKNEYEIFDAMNVKPKNNYFEDI